MAANFLWLHLLDRYSRAVTRGIVVDQALHLGLVRGGCPEGLRDSSGNSSPSSSLRVSSYVGSLSGGSAAFELLEFCFAFFPVAGKSLELPRPRSLDSGISSLQGLS